MKRILIDMDGVMADAYAQFATYHERETKVRKTIAETTGIPEFTAFPRAAEYAKMPGFFRDCPVIPGSREVIARLNQHYEIFIVSSATEFPNCLAEKIHWLAEHFPFIHWKQIVLCGSKRVARGDIMIDDHFGNLDHFEGRTLLFSQPHNRRDHPKPHERVESWDDIAKLLL